MRFVTVAAVLAFLALPAASDAMTKADAVALANAVNLVGTDMPGYTESPPDNSGGGGGGLPACAGAVPPGKALADIPSANFAMGDVSQFSSDVEVMPTAALVRKDVKAMKSTRAHKCIVKELRRELAKEGTVRSVKLTVLRPAVARTYGFRIKLRLESGPVAVTLFIDTFVIAEGPVETGLFALDGPHAPSAGEESRTLNLLATRLDTALHPPPVV